MVELLPLQEQACVVYAIVSLFASSLYLNFSNSSLSLVDLNNFYVSCYENV
jgi:hypothetical protein